MLYTRLLTLALLFCTFLSVEAQRTPLRFDQTTFNFGEVSNWKNPPAIFTFRNTGNEPVVFLPTFPKDDILVELPKNKIAPNENAKVTVYYYTEKTGDFRKKIELYTNVSKQPIELTLRGTILSMDANAFIQCPGFAPKSTEELAFEQGIRVIDEETKDPINQASVKIQQDKKEVVVETDQEGMAREQLNIGMYDLSVWKQGYNPEYETVYINKASGLITIELKPIPAPATTTTRYTYYERDDPREEDPKEPEMEEEAEEPEEKYVYEDVDIDRWDEEPEEEWAEAEALEEPEEPETNTIEEPESDIPQERPTETAIEMETKGNPELESNAELIEVLPVTQYNPNNIVFLIDVSSSMKKAEKLPLLKTAMKHLTAVLRDIDKITVITYSSETEVAMTTTQAGEKQKIIALIDSIQPAGWTHGVKGVETAYDMIEANFLKEGNNQVILATDGLFNHPNYSERDLFSYVREKNRDGIILSVIGFGDDRDAIGMMKKLAFKGRGNYLQIENEADATEVLVEEIKVHSSKSY